MGLLPILRLTETWAVYPANGSSVHLGNFICKMDLELRQWDPRVKHFNGAKWDPLCIEKQ